LLPWRAVFYARQNIQGREENMAFKVVDGLRTIEFGTPGVSRATLVDMVINGNKRATAGLITEYETEGEPLEHIGERLGILDNDDKMVVIVEVTDIEKLRFADVPDRFALAEGEGDLNGQDFRRSHKKYWESVGEKITDDTLVVTVYFDLVKKL